MSAARVAIVGPGAIGGTLAAWLWRAGHEVVVCARRPLAGPLVVETPGETLRPDLAVVTDPAAAPAADWTLVCTKAYDAAGAAAWLGGSGPVAIVQNGVEHRERFRAWLPDERLVPVVIDLPAERTGATHRQRGKGTLTVAGDAHGRAFAALFAGTPLELVVTDRWAEVAWRKLCVNAASVLTALVDRPNGVLRDEGLREVARGIVAEVIAVARAEGVALEDADGERVMARLGAGAPDGVNSILADRRAGRPTEIDARNGVIVRLGRHHGIATPCNQMAVALLTVMS